MIRAPEMNYAYVKSAGERWPFYAFEFETTDRKCGALRFGSRQPFRRCACREDDRSER